MEAKLVDELPCERGWQFEPKWDGFRCLAFRTGSEVALQAKSGKPLARYFPEVVGLLQSLPQKRFVLDGELVIREDATFSFDALQMRLHPTESRVRKLSQATPATFILFDMLLSPEGKSLLQKPLTLRCAVLEQFFTTACRPERLKLSPYTRDRREAAKWLDRAGHDVLDGVVAKRLDGLYEPGVRAMLKVKPRRTADCVVGGFRYSARGKEVGSLEARSCRLYVDYFQGRAVRTHQKARGACGSAGLHRWRTWRPEPLEHRAVGRVGAGSSQARRRGPLCTGDGRSFPPRHQAVAFSPRKSPPAVYARSAQGSCPTAAARSETPPDLNRLALM
jgi:ATP-dependent DNA ligase